MRLEFNSLRNAKTMLDHLERRGVDPKKVALVANRVGQPKEIPAAKVEEALARKFFAKIPDDPKAALGVAEQRRARADGIPLVVPLQGPASRWPRPSTPSPHPAPGS